MMTIIIILIIVIIIIMMKIMTIDGTEVNPVSFLLLTETCKRCSKM